MQLGKHFWPDFAFVNGLRIDYLSPTLYLLDALIAVFLFSFLPLLSKKAILRFLFEHRTVLFLLIATLVFGVLGAKSPLAATYGSLRLLEMAFFGIGAWVVMRREGKKAVTRLGVVFSLGLLLASGIGLLQFFNQGSVGGLLYFLGERTFSSETPGIANASVDGALVLRPYSTFPHPNVFSWYLLTGVVFATAAILQRWRSRLSIMMLILLLLASIVGSGMIVLTMGRITFMLLIGYFLSLPFLSLSSHKKNLFLLTITGIFLVLVLLFTTGTGERIRSLSFSEEPVRVRAHLLQAARSMFVTSPIAGVGLNNFLVNLPAYYPTGSGRIVLQPVHNIYLLTLAEGGLIGLGLLFLMLLRAFQRVIAAIHSPFRFAVLYLLAASIIAGLFDHYLITLEQGQIFFAFLLALAFSFPKKAQRSK